LKEVEMETRPAGAATQLSAPNDGANTRRKRRNGNETSLRYFLPKDGSSTGTPELGEEVASEGEALIQAFKTGQPFYTLAAWKAVPEVNGGGSPVIVKQAVARS
jgi:hypothetical protein